MALRQGTTLVVPTSRLLLSSRAGLSPRGICCSDLFCNRFCSVFVSALSATLQPLANRSNSHSLRCRMLNTHYCKQLTRPRRSISTALLTFVLKTVTKYKPRVANCTRLAADPTNASRITHLRRIVALLPSSACYTMNAFGDLPAWPPPQPIVQSPKGRLLLRRSLPFPQNPLCPVTRRRRTPTCSALSTP
jgi:hypothetical protein